MQFLFNVFPIISLSIFILVLTSIIYTVIKGLTAKHKPIKTFRINNKKYLLYSYQTYYKYSNQIIYELKNELGESLGKFNNLNDILLLLNIDEFPNEDQFM